MKPARIALMGGMGYPLTETTWGMPTFKTRLEALGAIVLLVSWDSRQSVYEFLHDFTGFRALCGDSLGAGSAAQYAGDQGGRIDFVGGFQPSMDDTRTIVRGPGNGVQILPHNITEAHCIYDPVWWHTMGLGQCRYEVPQGSKTKLLTTEHAGAHPDDWGISQTVMFNHLKGLMP